MSNYSVTPPPGGVLPYKNDGAARCKIWKTSVKGATISLCGCDPNSFSPQRQTIRRLFRATSCLKYF